MRDKDDWVEANRLRGSWGTKNYSHDMDFSHCMQSEPTDKHGTVDEIFNAMCYYDVFLEESTCRDNSIHLLKTIQKGISDENFTNTGLSKKLDNHYGMRKPANPQEIANLVHNYLDWLRATNKRTWDSRGLNPSRQMLDSCVKGLYLNSATFLHYDEDSKR